LYHCRAILKISSKSVKNFLSNVANRQTNKHTNANDFITSLAKVKNAIQLETNTSGRNGADEDDSIYTMMSQSGLARAIQPDSNSA